MTRLFLKSEKRIPFLRGYGVPPSPLADMFVKIVFFFYSDKLPNFEMRFIRPKNVCIMYIPLETNEDVQEER